MGVELLWRVKIGTGRVTPEELVPLIRQCMISGREIPGTVDQCHGTHRAGIAETWSVHQRIVIWQSLQNVVLP
jgi:hypothetical protein